MTLTDLKVVKMQSENVGLALEKELVVSQSFDKLEGKDQENKQPNDQENQLNKKESRKSTKVKVAKRLCIFE